MKKNKKIRTKKSGTQSSGSHLGSILILSIICALGLMFFSLPTFILVVPGLMPTMASLLFDSRARGSRLCAIATFNLAGIVPFLDSLWEQEATVKMALNMISDVYTWVVIYGAAGVAMVVISISPHIAVGFLQISNDIKRKKLISWKNKMIEEWGDELSEALSSSETKATTSKKPA